jgi:hypothetical protein
MGPRVAITATGRLRAVLSEEKDLQRAAAGALAADPGKDNKGG